MNFRLVLNILSFIIVIFCAFMILPLVIAFCYGEFESAIAFSAVGGGVLLFFLALFFITKNRREQKLKTRDGFLLVTLCWIFMSLIGTLPFLMAVDGISFVDAFFESVSGISTTGATIFDDIEVLPYSIIFWRSLLQWIGGMGIIVLTVAILPLLGVSGLSLMKAETTGATVDKISNKITSTAKILWLIYIGLTFAEIIFLLCCKVSLFDSIIHSFSTIATGGFSSKNSSIAFYNSKVVQWGIAIFMFLSGINFSLIFRALTLKFKEVFRNSEFRLYCLLVFLATVFIASNLFSKTASVEASLRDAFFQVVAVITTTGFATSDYTLWPNFSQGIIFLLFFCGACTGSTSGGIKLFRLITCGKIADYQFKSLVYPQGVFSIKINGQQVLPKTLYEVCGFIFLYLVITVLLTVSGFCYSLDFSTSLSCALASIGNIGPAFGAASPSCTYSEFPTLLKLLYSFAMIIGRLELYTVLIVFVPRFWRG